MDGSVLGSLSRRKLCFRPCPLPIPLASRRLPNTWITMFVSHLFVPHGRPDGAASDTHTPYRRVLRPLAKLNSALLLLSIEDAFGIRWASFFAAHSLLILYSLRSLTATAVDPPTRRVMPDAISAIPQMELIHQFINLFINLLESTQPHDP